MTYMPPASPANIDASLTSLSAGSLTTVARADHVHTVSKVPVLIASTTLTSTATNVTLSNIPSTYTSLCCMLSLRSENASVTDAALIQFNGDTGTNYRDSSSLATASSYILVTYVPGTTNVAGSSGYAVNSLTIFDYTSTKHKTTSALGTLTAASATVYGPQVQVTEGVWLSTATITSVKVYLSSGQNLSISSSVRLYGIP